MQTNDRLRELVLAMDGELSSSSDETKMHWAELVGLLALGPSPVRRPCPFCNGSVTLDATRCGYCWKALPVHVETPSA